MEDTPKLNFLRDGNVYLFGEIDETIPENVIAPLVRLVTERELDKDPKPITIFISSDGGDAYYALDLISIIESCRGKVQINTMVTSHAFSAASMIAVCGHKRFATRWASHLVHYPRSWDFSHNPEMAEINVDALKFLTSEMLNIYKQRTKIKDLDKKLISDNYIVSGKELVKVGLVDKIL